MNTEKLNLNSLYFSPGHRVNTDEWNPIIYRLIECCFLHRVHIAPPPPGKYPVIISIVFCSRMLAGIAGSNPAEGMNASLLWVLMVFRERSLRGADHLPRAVLLMVVCLSVVAKPRKWGRPGPLGAAGLWKKCVKYGHLKHWFFLTLYAPCIILHYVYKPTRCTKFLWIDLIFY